MEEVELVAEMQLGEAAKAFWGSQVGRYVLGRLQEEIEGATDELADADPTDSTSIRTLQDRIRRAKALPEYLAELISQGSQASQVLDEAGGP